MSEEEQNVLKEAKGVPSELRSLEESLTEIESRLFEARGAHRFDDETPGVYDPDKLTELLDRRRALKTRIMDAHRRSTDALIRAEEIIEGVKDPKVRAVLRYYYLCGKSIEKIAELVERSEKTVKRYLYS